ncbi:MAG: acetate--CoA ligase family protein [Myxococcales bacterium]|nr:acetate--CoA ligase family protein [Myxococcales bacterium]
MGDHHGWLPPEATRAVLAAYGIAQPSTQLATSADDAAAAADAVGYPVAIKLASATITHKTDVGGVILDVADAAAVRQAFADIHARLATIGRAAEMAGVTVQPMVPRGVELFVGATRTPGFGPLIGFGIGGVAVELWKDVGFRVHPLTDADARDLVDGVRAQALLDGFRGGPVADRAALRRHPARRSPDGRPGRGARARPQPDRHPRPGPGRDRDRRPHPRGVISRRCDTPSWSRRRRGRPARSRRGRRRRARWRRRGCSRRRRDRRSRSRRPRRGRSTARRSRSRGPARRR